MLEKVKVKAAAWGLAGLFGAGSLFSGIAAQNVYAQDDAAVESVNENTEDAGNTEISDQINETQDSYSGTSADTLQSAPVTEDNEGNSPSESPEQNSTAVENGTETEGSEDPYIETTTDTQNDDNTKDFSGTGATKDTKAVQAKKNGWVKENGGYKYYKNGKAYTGWHKMGKAEGEKKAHWCYFGKNGVMYTGWKKMGKAEGEKTAHWCYFGSNGWMRTGWVKFGKGTSEPDGNTKQHWCYFGSNGWLRTGWVKFGKGTANPDGNVAKHWSYFGKNGWMRTGWVQFGKGTSELDGNTKKHWCYFGNNGWMRTGWQTMGTKNNPDGKSKKHTSYFGSNGWMRTGWVQFGKGTSEPDGNTPKHWSYFGNDGWLRTGWQDMGKGTKNPDGNSAKHTSYFGDDGWLRTGNQEVGSGWNDRKPYSFSNNGWLRDAYYEDGKKFTGVYTRGYGEGAYSLYVFKDGKLFTGNAEKEIPKEYNVVKYTNTYNMKDWVSTDSRFAKRETFKEKFFTYNGVTGISLNGYGSCNLFVNGKGVYGEGSQLRNFDDKAVIYCTEGTNITLKISGDTYNVASKKYTDNSGYSYSKAEINLKKYYEAGTSYTITIDYKGKKASANYKVQRASTYFGTSTFYCYRCDNYVNYAVENAVEGDTVVLEDSKGGTYTQKIGYNTKKYYGKFYTKYTSGNYKWFKFTVKDKNGKSLDTYTWNLKWG